MWLSKQMDITKMSTLEIEQPRKVSSGASIGPDATKSPEEQVATSTQLAGSSQSNASQGAKLHFGITIYLLIRFRKILSVRRKITDKQIFRKFFCWRLPGDFGNCDGNNRDICFHFGNNNNPFGNYCDSTGDDYSEHNNCDC
jgi:hypothetical protein